MSLFVGLDVSQRLTHLCVVDADGKRVWRGKCTTGVSNHIRGVMKIFGLVVVGVRGTAFAARVEELVADRPEVQSIVAPMLGIWLHLRSQVAAFDRQLLAVAKTRPACRLLMSIPGVGYVSALAFMGAIDVPERFADRGRSAPISVWRPSNINPARSTAWAKSPNVATLMFELSWWRRRTRS